MREKVRCGGEVDRESHLRGATQQEGDHGREMPAYTREMGRLSERRKNFEAVAHPVPGRSDVALVADLKVDEI